MSSRKSANTKHKARRLKIGYHIYDLRREGRRTASRTVPFLRLAGRWLQQAGFNVGEGVRVEVSDGRIVLVPE